jgi:hypothetical protein
MNNLALSGGMLISSRASEAIPLLMGRRSHAHNDNGLYDHGEAVADHAEPWPRCGGNAMYRGTDDWRDDILDHIHADRHPGRDRLGLNCASISARPERRCAPQFECALRLKIKRDGLFSNRRNSCASTHRASGRSGNHWFTQELI